MPHVRGGEAIASRLRRLRTRVGGLRADFAFPTSLLRIGKPPIKRAAPNLQPVTRLAYTEVAGPQGLEEDFGPNFRPRSNVAIAVDYLDNGIFLWDRVAGLKVHRDACRWLPGKPLSINGNGLTDFGTTP